jgi:hypothetical protein
VDLKSLSMGERIAAGSGAALFFFLFPSWIQGQSGWELFKIVDVLLAILALAAVAFPLAKAAGYKQQLRPSDRALLTRIGAVALVLVLAYFLEAFNTAQVGLWLSVLAAAGLFYGAVTTPGEEAPPRRRDRARRPRAHDDFEEPPPGMESWRGSAGAGEDPGAGDAGIGARGTGEGETDPGLSSPEPPRRTEERPRRESSFEELEFDPEPDPERTQARRPRRPPEVPPPAG